MPTNRGTTSPSDSGSRWCQVVAWHQIVDIRGTGRQRRSLTGESQLLSMAEALSRLVPNADCRVIFSDSPPTRGIREIARFPFFRHDQLWHEELTRVSDAVNEIR